MENLNKEKVSIHYKHNETGIDFVLRHEDDKLPDGMTIQRCIAKNFGEEVMDKMMKCYVDSYLDEWNKVLSNFNLELEYDPS